MVKIIYWSMTGNTEQMAEAILSGVEESGAPVELININDGEPTIDEGDALMLGCPAMGDEELEPDVYEPWFAQVEADGVLNNRKVALFGSYSWNSGEWMHTWADRVKDAGGILFEDAGKAVYSTPTDEDMEDLKAFGNRFGKENA